MAAGEVSSKSEAADLEQAVSDWLDEGFAILALYGISGGGSCACGRPDCENAGKHPRHRHGVHDATRNLDRIRRWIHGYVDLNLGLSCEGFRVFDLDGRAGERSLEALAELYGHEFPRTRTQRTGNGRHLIFRDETGTCSSRLAGNLPGLHVRAAAALSSQHGEAPFRPSLSGRRDADRHVAELGERSAARLRGDGYGDDDCAAAVAATLGRGHPLRDRGASRRARTAAAAPAGPGPAYQPQHLKLPARAARSRRSARARASLRRAVRGGGCDRDPRARCEADHQVGASSGKRASPVSRCFKLGKLQDRSGLSDEAFRSLLLFYARQGLAGAHESGEGVWLCFRPKQVFWFGHPLELDELEAIS